MSDTNDRNLESRLRIIEDKLAIYELIASHRPIADTAHSRYTSSVYLEDGVFDRGRRWKALRVQPTSPPSR